MKHTILKGMTAVILLAGLFPALATAQSSQELYQLREEYPFSSNNQLLEIYEQRKREGQNSFAAPGKEYEALQEQLNGYQRVDEQKRRARDQQQRAYQDWITGNSPPRSQNRYRPPDRYRPPARATPPQKTQRSTGYGNNQQRQDLLRGNTPSRRSQPSVRNSGKKPAGFSMDNYNRAMGNPPQSQKPSGVTTNSSRGRGLDRFRAGEVQKLTPQKKPVKYCSCRGDDWNEFDVMCQPLGNATNNYPPGYFPWTPKCHRVVWK